MKLYLFYQIASKLGSMTPSLYAYTEKKQFKKEFIETRNMNFFYLKEKEVTKEEYMKFRDKFQNFRLSHYEFLTKVKNSIRYKEKIQILSTENESLFIYTSAIDNIFVLLGEMINLKFASCLKKEYLNALNELGYFQIGKWYGGLPFDEMTYMDVRMDMEEGELNFEIDEFQLFLYYYGDLMK